MNRASVIAILLVVLLPALPAAAEGTDGRDAAGTVRGFRVEAPDLPGPVLPLRLEAVAPMSTASAVSAASPGADAGPAAGQQAVRSDEPPPRDKIGGFQLNLLGGVQLVGSASGQGGVALSYFKPSTAALGLEAEAGITLGPNGEVYHGLLSVILQSGARSSKIAPYLALGGGYFRAQVDLRDAVQEELPNFGVEPPDGEEEGPLIALGFGVRYYLNDWLAIRLDYREFRALTEADGSFLDRLFALRRIGGMLSIEF